MKRAIVHPPLLTAFPIVSLYSANLALVPLRDLLRPLGLAVAGVVLLWLLASAVSRSWRKGAIFASLLSLAVLTYGHAHKMTGPASFGVGEGPRLGLLGGMLVAALAVAVLLCWKQTVLEGATKFLNFASALLIVVACGDIAVKQLAPAPVADRRVAKKFEMGPTELALGYAPDVFCIVLDGYGRTDVLKDYYGLDNTGFVKELESRGFQVAEKSRTNYIQTQLSVTSMLNMRYLPEILDTDAPNLDRTALFVPLRDNAVQQFLHSLGYASVAVGTGYDPVIPTRTSWTVRLQSRGTLFDILALDLTPFGRNKEAVSDQFESHYNRIIDAFNWLGNLGDRGRYPRFVFAHILKPHPPFVLAEDATYREPTEGRFGFNDATDYLKEAGTPEGYRAGYIEQVQGLNKLVLRAVDAIQKSASRPPVIVLVSDHGPKLKLDQESLARTDTRESIPNFVAVLMPGDSGFTLRQDITLANVFREVFNSTFKAGFERLPDKSYFSPWAAPFKFTEVVP